MKRYYFSLLGLALAGTLASGLAGCAGPAGRAPRSEARELAASFLAGRAFDRSEVALKSDNTEALRRAGRDYARASGLIEDKGVLLRGVLPLSLEGMQLDDMAKSAPPSQRRDLLKRALKNYRAASALLPTDPKPGSVDAITLNMVGYPLADRGTTRADWQRAAQLTRLSLAEWDRQIALLPPGSAERLNAQAARTLGALDSYAWSLFKLGRTQEAVQKQEAVVAFVRAHPEVVSSPQSQYSAEIPFHMAEIYNSAGREEEAGEQYRTALDINPTPELLQRIDIALNAASV